MSDTKTLDLAHFSMLYSLTEPRAISDATKAFKRGYDWVTGTEAGEDPMQKSLRVAAHTAGYTFHVYKSNWIAVKRILIKPGTWTKGGVSVVDNKDVVGPGHDLNIAWDQFEMAHVGRITVLCSHYATKGKPDGRTPEYRRNLAENAKLASKIGDLGDTYGEGKALVFYGGDQNIVDRDNDTFFGEGFTSAWDELEKYENTGHGNIDVIASYNKDGRVEAKYIRALDDSELKLFTDHFPVEAGFTVKLLKA